MKTKIFISIALIICALVLSQSSQAQIVMHESGSISLLENTTDWNKGLQIYHNGVYYFNTEQNHDFHWVTVATPGSLTGKCWVVTSPTSKYIHNFYVEGDGDVYRKGCYTNAVANPQIPSAKKIAGAGNILNGITGVFYIPEDEPIEEEKVKQRIGLYADDVKKVLPEAVAIDDAGVTYVNYEALTVVLIEAYKEQKAEIELLRKTLEEHGLLEPEK